MAFMSRYLLPALAGVVALSAYAEDAGRRIEEIVVTAEKRVSTVSDTSISITAFGQEMIEDFGIQGADELVNFLPSTTRDQYDIRMRGVGRNFRALGGDPGVGTYYNGVYSEDFGIASSESALYDIARVEALRGPQGTLYGRNSIGGALNYITNKPTYETEAEIRTMLGSLGTEEFYGVLSGPIIDDKLAYRLVASTRDRDGGQDGADGSEDVNSIGDQNIALSLNWQIADDWEFNIRFNDRASHRKFGNLVLSNEGHAFNRGARDPDNYALGIVQMPVTPGPLFGFFPVADFSGDSWDFTDPNTGATVTGIYARPGTDEASSLRPSPAFGVNPNVLQLDTEDLDGDALTNNRNDERFDQQAVQTELSWGINDTTELKFIGGWSDFEYTFFQDFDRSVSELTQYHQVVKQSLENYSLELQLLWQLGDALQMTSGLYYFDQDLRQEYSVADDAAQGRITNAVNYGGMEGFVAFLGPHKNLGDAAFGEGLLGRWDGQADGKSYSIDNNVETTAWAAYTQGTYTFNENWALVVGVRYAEDDKDAIENRFAYVESSVYDGAVFSPGAVLDATGFYEGFCQFTLGLGSCADAGLSHLSVMNIFMGNAIPTAPNLFDPNGDFGASAMIDNPLIPTCALDDPDCATPLRLQGVPISFAEASKGSESWSDTNFRVNVDWTPNDDTLIYFGITTGYRSGGYSLGLLGTQSAVRDPATGVIVPLQTGAPLSYDKETVVSYEIGYKGALFDDTLQIFSAVYFYDYEGYQDEVQSANSVTGGSDNIIINAGDATNWGWEIEAIWLPTDAWTIGGNYSYADTEYKDDNFLVEDDNPAFPNSLTTLIDLNSSTGVPEDNLATPLCNESIEGPQLPGSNVCTSLYSRKVVNIKGNDLKRIPQHKATLYSFYDLNFTAGTLTLGGTYSYTGEFQDTPVERALDEVDSRYRVDLSATWRDNADRFTIRAFIDNVTDEGSARGLGTGTAGSNWQLTSTYLYPRFYGIDMTYRFKDL